MKFIWKNICTRVWLIISIIVMVFFTTATLVATQNNLIYNTVNSVLGRERRVLVEGDPSQYQYYETEFTTKEQALEAANKLNEEIVGEGIILLKNQSKSLPLAEKAKISVFGKNSVNLVYGGSGSAGSNAQGATLLEDALTAANFDVNKTLTSFYKDNARSGSGRPASPAMGTVLAGFATGETPVSSYTDDVKKSFSEYNDAAIVVISRIGGEGFDLPRTMKTSFKSDEKVAGAKSADSHYLELDQNETDLINMVCENFENVIVVVNCSQAMELGFLEDERIDSAVWIGGMGKTGINALGRVLNGEINPSGRTVDTFARDFTQDPTWNNFGNNNIENGNRYNVDGKSRMNYFVQYEEGIYVGYRYYETRGFTDGEEWYKNNVVYPLGYGLSYTTFEYEWAEEPPALTEIQADSVITLKVRVTNTGETAGKEVVQLYYTAPYTDGEVEKSHVVLGAFDKTELIEPGKSEVVELTIRARDMASYDYSDANNNGSKTYELDGGKYQLKVSKNAHEPVLTAEYNLDKTVIYNTDDATGNEVKNRFDDVSNNPEGVKTYLSRSDWEGTWPTTPTDEDRSTTQEFLNSLQFDKNDAGKKWEETEMPEQAKKKVGYNQTKVKLYDLIGEPYGSKLWDELLNQLTVDEMANLVGIGNFTTQAIERIAKPKTIDADGPVGFTIFMGDDSVYDTAFYACGCVIAATYNEDMAYAMGEMVGNEGLLGNLAGDKTTYSGWYAPAANIHRSPFGGRNWEYMSEDGLLSGKIAANIIKGAKSKGVYTFMKHFAVNDQESNRDTNGLLTWLNEQSMREIYLKPFEIAVKEGKTTAMMSSFNRIGTVWAGGSYELLTEILRDEWGFRGTVITDFNTPTYRYMDPDQMIRAGGDLNLSADKMPSTDSGSLTATQVSSLRNATKNILYTVVNSNVMNGYGDGVIYRYALPYWVIAVIVVDVVVVLSLAVWGFFVIRVAKKRTQKKEI